MLLHPYSNECFLRQTTFLVAQQIATKYRSQRQGYKSRCKQGHDEGNAQWHQHTTFHTTQEEERHETHDDNQSRIEDRHTHFFRSLEHHFQNALTFSLRQETVFTQTLPHVLHIDNGIVHQRTNGNGHTTQTHGIDTQPQIMKHEDRHHQGQWNSDQ